MAVAIFYRGDGTTFNVPIFDLGETIPSGSVSNGLGRGRNFDTRSAVKWSDVYDYDLPSGMCLENRLGAITLHGNSNLQDPTFTYDSALADPSENIVIASGSVTQGISCHSIFQPYPKCKTWLVTFRIGGTRYMGFILRGIGWGYDPDYQDCVTLYYASSPNSPVNVLFEQLGFDMTAGDKGFRPTGDQTKNEYPGIGGRPDDDLSKTDPDYPSDSILQPGAPDESVASAAGSGFITAYNMDTSNLRELGKCLFSQTITDALLNVLINPLDFIVSLNVFPCSPSVGAAVPIKLGRWECRSGSLTGALGFNASGQPLTHQFSDPPLDFGTISIPENWGSFLDYTHTRIELYLPFIGTVDLDVSECMGGTVNVQYTIDYFTGMCVANVLCLRPITLASGKIIGTRPAQHSYQGNCAIQVPLSAESYGSMLGNIINSCTRLIGNPAMAPVTIAEGALNGLNPSVTTKGSVVANAGFCSVLNPYVRITRPVTAAPASYQEVVGYPSYINTSLAYCQDLCICEDINLDNINGATQSELERIRRLCREGVFV